MAESFFILCLQKVSIPLKNGLLKPLRSLTIHCLHQVSIGVERRRDRRVAEPILEHLHMDTLGDEQGGMGVAQVVEPPRLTDRQRSHVKK